MRSSVVDLEVNADARGVLSLFFDVKELLGELRCFADRLHHIGVLLGRLVGRVGCERLPAPHTSLFRLRRFSVTARAGDRRELVSVVLVGDLQAHELGVFIADVGVEDGHIARDRVRPVGAPLAPLDVPGGHALFGQPGEIRLSEVRRRDVAFDASTLGRSLEHVQVGLVGELVWNVQRTPQCVLVSPRMVTQPAIDVRRRRDQVDRPLASLSIHSHCQPMLRFRYRTDSQVVEFTTAQASIELHGDRGGIPRVATGVDHRLDVVLPVEHLVRRRTGVVVSRERGVDPVDAIRWCVRPVDPVIGRTPAEDSQRDPIVLVRLRRLVQVIGVVDPMDDLFGGSLLLERSGDAGVGFLGHSCAVSQEFFMTVPAVRLPQEFHLIREIEQDGAFFLAAATLASLDLLAKSDDSLLRVAHGLPFIHWLLSVWLKSLHRLSSLCLHANSGDAENHRADTPSLSDKSYPAIDNNVAQAGVTA